MKNFVFLVVLFLSFLSCSTTSESIVKKFHAARNAHDFEKSITFLDAGYKELFIDGTVDVKNRAALKKQMEWGEVMESKSTMLSINHVGNRVHTIELFSNFIDTLASRKSRTFKVIYRLENNKIQTIILDTLPGFQKQLLIDSQVFLSLKEFCSQQDKAFNFEENVESAQKLRKCILLYLQTE